jgi:pimeloyl-ACP methyl ester carboxylesterase
VSAPARQGTSRLRRWTARTALGAGIALSLAGATLAWGWWVQPSVLVVPLRQVGYWRLGVTLRSVEVGGHAWPYLEAGPADGPPMVFLHGYGTSKDAMMSMAAYFARRGWRTIAPDLPGFGAHAFHRGERHDGAFYAREAGRFMDAVGVPEAVIVGTSMGGAVSCEMAISHPDRVRALLMLSPAGVDPPVRNAFMRRADAGENPLDLATEADFERITATVFARPPVVPAPFRRWFVEQAVARRDDTLQIADALRPFLVSGLDGRMGAVRAPTFVLYGTADMVTDPSMMSTFAREIPAARTALIPGAGHVAFSDDFPATVGAMNAFLREAGLSPPAPDGSAPAVGLTPP